MNQDKECDRCGFIANAGNDQKEVMNRHVAGRHTRHITKSERTGEIIKGFTNLDIGKVRWLTVW